MKKINFPPYLQWEVTPRCNHNCIHCYNYWRSEGKVMNETKLYHEITDKIIDVHPVSVVITGGEPLLVFQKIKYDISRLVDNGISVSINTNADLVNDEIALFLKKHNISAFVSLPCSEKSICDMITNTKNSVINTSHGIKKLIDNGVRVTVNMVVMKSNIDYIYSTAKYCIENLHVNSFFASRVGKPINASTEFDTELLTLTDLYKMQKELIRIKRNFGIRVGTAGPIPACSINSDDAFQLFAYRKNCSAGKTSYGIDSNGNVKACPRDEKIYGNILNEDFSTIWERMSEWRDGSLLPEECKECSAKNRCGGGCRLDSFPHTGQKNKLDTMANLDNLPIKYTKHATDINVEFDTKLFVPPSLKFLKEDFGWRVSNFGKTIYITDEMKNFLENNDYFTIRSFSDSNDLPIDISKAIIFQLLRNNILLTEQFYKMINLKEVK